MAGVNKVILVGNLGKDPEVRDLEGGASVANFPLATSESYKDKNGNKVEHTEWHNIVVWRGLAEIARKYLKKGSTICVEGKIRTRSWEKDGSKRYTTEIIAENFTMLGGNNARKEDGSQNSNSSNEHSLNEETMMGANSADDLPF